jgi:hypothetical protein
MNLCAYKFWITYHIKITLNVNGLNNPNNRQMMWLRHSTVTRIHFQNVQSPRFNYQQLLHQVLTIPPVMDKLNKHVLLSSHCQSHQWVERLLYIGSCKNIHIKWAWKLRHMWAWILPWPMSPTKNLNHTASLWSEKTENINVSSWIKCTLWG